MQIKDVENLAELARLELSMEEKEQLLSDMEGILGYIKQIEEADVSTAKEDYDLKNVWREDEAVKRNFSRELIIEQFPDSQPARPDDSGHSGGDVFLKVKKIL